uniref:CAZy families GH38 protein n=1 Tax=uncultured Dinoroseobacter sp. TaxID=570015 RepID=A0A060CES9_9RHOB|nr:CAZy families GH38 protein [uncultured Dinoroseobacter sp.]
MPIDEVDSVKLVQRNGLRDIIEIKRHWQGSTFTQDISLDNGADHAVVSNQVEWHEKHIFLKAAFPLAASAPGPRSRFRTDPSSGQPPATTASRRRSSRCRPSAGPTRATGGTVSA